MGLSEEVAEKYLVHLGFKSIDYEKDGNVPPDFVVDDGIAVEGPSSEPE